jgi:hypothetical protein
LLEDLFDYLPNTSQMLSQFADSIFNPSVEVTELDCGTTLGKVSDLTFGAVGYIELATNLPITTTRITSLLGQGIYKIALRNLHSCTAIGGICQECYRGSFPYDTIPQINSILKIPSEYTFTEDVYITDGVTQPSYTLTVPDGFYSNVLVYAADVFVQPTAYSITDNVLTFTYVPVAGTNIVIKYVTDSAKPFLNYLAASYSGSLLGMKPLPTSPIVLRESLLKSMITPTQLDMISRELVKYNAIPESQISFSDTISDPLERALFMIALFGIYSNVQV